MGLKRLLVMGALALSLVCLLVLAFVRPGTPGSTLWSGGRAVGLIRITGVIADGDGLNPSSGAAAADRVVAELDRVAHDARVSVILLRVNSPGGSAAASQEIHDAVLNARKLKPVVVSMGDVAASGAYYLSVAADKIVADPATLTGSIGVVSEFLNYKALANDHGVSAAVITSGPNKAIGNPLTTLTEQQRAVIQGIVDDTYQQFVSAVAAGRKLPEAKVKPLADGRAYTGRQALALGLIDQLGGYQEALDVAAKLGDIRGRPKVIDFTEAPPFVDRLLGSVSQAVVQGMTAASGLPSGARGAAMRLDYCDCEVPQ
ncbi:MAG TPA: signal peptide peptidase SppA [Limnochordia bacterium]|nr:signal peptide peptidase SppA [Limnochordia bacterium]